MMQQQLSSAMRAAATEVRYPAIQAGHVAVVYPRSAGFWFMAGCAVQSATSELPVDLAWADVAGGVFVPAPSGKIHYVAMTNEADLRGLVRRYATLPTEGILKVIPATPKLPADFTKLPHQATVFVEHESLIGGVDIGELDDFAKAKDAIIIVNCPRETDIARNHEFEWLRHGPNGAGTLRRTTLAGVI